jgi:uncharacterized membrane protein YsdA (DUF1294 family)/cold shock CspA family protein
VRHKGQITNWNDDRGFGFITPAAGGEQVFVHIKSFVNRGRRPAGSDIVTYEVTRDPKGRSQGVNVAYAGERSPPTSAAKPLPGSIIFAGLFLAAVTGTVLAGLLPLFVLGLYVLGSAITYLVYAWDKSAAKKDGQRTPENTLHVLGLLGGWPGALVAQTTLRHKSRKTSFRIVFWATVAMNCAGLFWAYSNMERFAVWG